MTRLRADWVECVPKSRHRVVIPDETRADEEIGRVFDQILGVERIDPGELIVAETDRQAARLDRDRRPLLADDKNVAPGIGKRFLRVSRCRGERRQQQERAHGRVIADRSEEHTSELQSLMRISYAVFCWKKKSTKHHDDTT